MIFVKKRSPKETTDPWSQVLRSWSKPEALARTMRRTNWKISVAWSFLLSALMVFPAVFDAFGLQRCWTHGSCKSENSSIDVSWWRGVDELTLSWTSVFGSILGFVVSISFYLLRSSWTWKWTSDTSLGVLYCGSMWFFWLDPHKLRISGLLCGPPFAVQALVCKGFLASSEMGTEAMRVRIPAILQATHEWVAWAQVSRASARATFVRATSTRCSFRMRNSIVRSLGEYQRGDDLWSDTSHPYGRYSSFICSLGWLHCVWKGPWCQIHTLWWSCPASQGFVRKEAGAPGHYEHELPVRGSLIATDSWHWRLPQSGGWPLECDRGV